MAGAFHALTHLDGSNGSTTFVEASGKTITRTGTDITISTAQSKFGGASGSFLANINNNLSIPANTKLNGDFTWGAWVYMKAGGSGNRGIMSLGTSNWELYVGTGGSLAVYNGGAVVASAASGSVPDTTWCFVCAERTGATVTLTVDGVVKATGTSAVAYDATTMYIGSWYNGAEPANAYIDDPFLFTHGTLFGGSSFTPPSVAMDNSARGGVLVVNTTTVPSGTTIAVPAEAVAGDLLVLCCTNGSNPGAFIPAAVTGFTMVVNEQYGTVATRVMQSGDTSFTLPATYYAVMTALRSAGGQTPTVERVLKSTPYTANSTFATGSGTVSANNSLALLGFFSRRGAFTGAPSPANTYLVPATVVGPGSSGMAVGAADVVSSGTFAGASFAGSADSNYPGGAVALILNPATVGAFNAVQTLAGVSQVAAVAVAANTSATQTLAAVSQAATSAVIVKASASQTLATVSQAATASTAAYLAGAQTLGGVSQVATVTVTAADAHFSAAQALGGVTQSAAAVVVGKASAAQQLAGVSQTATAVVQNVAHITGAQTLDGVAQGATALVGIASAAAQTLDGVSQAATATVADTVRAFMAAQVLAAVTQTARMRHRYVFERNERTRDVQAEQRGLVVIAEVRSFDVQAESRMVALAGENRRIAFTD